MRWRDLEPGYKDRAARLALLAPHELLGVDETSTPAQVKAAYLRLVKTYHPDHSDPFMARSNEEVMKLVTAAYERLKGSR